MRTVNIADLKNNLSAYLERVRAGEELLVKDRNRPVAKLVPLMSGDDPEGEGGQAGVGAPRSATAGVDRGAARRPRAPVGRGPARTVRPACARLVPACSRSGVVPGAPAPTHFRLS